MERVIWAGDEYGHEWLPAPFRPPRDQTSQASAVCFIGDGAAVVLVGSQTAWGLPGGHPEKGEALEDALVREVAEEACAEVVSASYLGSVRVTGPLGRDSAEVSYQARYAAIVHLLPFIPSPEAPARKLVAPSEFLATLAWGDSELARALLHSAASARAGLSSVPLGGPTVGRDQARDLQ